MGFRKRTKEEALNEITELVKAFEVNKKQYLDDSYNEANVRSNFIDKFFEALNWDVRNDDHLAERFRDVIVEDRLEIDGQIKAPDYSFCIKGQRVFYVEAKKPSIDIKNEVAPAFQVRRYAYTKGLKLSILTDFEEFAVYETSTKPKKNDKASKSRIKFITYKDYIKEFDYFWDVFSYDAVAHGKFDNYINSDKKLKGTSTIDKDFLDTIENWRKELAKNIALRNANLSLSDLNFAVQKIIDRIIFLRIVEEKGIEQPDYLKYISTLKIGIYKGLIKYFKDSNERYNSGLFKEYDWLNKIVVDDTVLNKIINELYFPECPYAWNELPIEILGNIYEKFLGSTITFRNVANGNHTAIVEEKPEIKKAGGVFYTPKYIVDYIVKETIGKKLEKCSLADVDKITICDPACGSGSFLVGAYKYLLDWYLNQYTIDIKKIKAYLKPDKNGYIRLEKKYTKNDITEYKLTIKEKQRILLKHIYGVDIDFNATEVTKLSLFLVLLNDEGIDGGNNDLSFIKLLDYKLLPNMTNNIKCGNSLVGTDYYMRNFVNQFNIEEQMKINAFDWEKEFNEIFNNGGFDVVIGNPPYIKEKVNKDVFLPLHNNEIYQGKMDFWYFFVEKSIKIIKTEGLISMIATSDWVSNDGAEKFRNYLLDNMIIKKYVDFGDYKIFDSANIQTMIFVLQKNRNKINQKNTIKYKKILNSNNAKINIVQYLQNEINDNNCIVKNIAFSNKDNKNKYIKFNSIGDNENIIKKISNMKNMSLNFDEVGQGIVPAPDNCFVIKDIKEFTQKEKKYIKVWHTGLKNKWEKYEDNSYIIYLCDNNFSNNKLSDFKNLNMHFEKFKNILKEAKVKYGTPYKPYYYLHRERDEKFFKKGSGKIILQVRCDKTRFYYTEDEFYGSRALFFIQTDKVNLKYLTAIFNSKLANFYFRNTGKEQGKLLKIEKKSIMNFPVLKANNFDENIIIKMVDNMLTAIKNFNDAKSDLEKKNAKNIVDAIDRKIDEKVYELYKLSKEDIKIIENTIK